MWIQASKNVCGSALLFKSESEHEQEKEKFSQNWNLEESHAQINHLVDTMTCGLTDCSASCGAKHKWWPPQLSFSVNVSAS